MPLDEDLLALAYAANRAPPMPIASGPAPEIPFCPHAPTPKQREFLSIDTLEALYGGAAGGGKSDALLMSALRFVDVPGYSALVLRKSYADLSLPKALMDRANEWLRGSGATWSGSEKRWTFPSGATLVFGYMETDADRFRYQSAEFQQVIFDELTQFTEAQYTYMMSRLRRLASATVPLFVRSATNPGNIGHKWVKSRFVEPPSSVRPFVPSRLDDNPHVDADSYRKNLAQLDPTTRDQLERGLWILDDSTRVYRFDATRNVVDAMPANIDRKGWQWLFGVDLGASERAPTTGFVRLAWHPHDPRTYVARAWCEAGITPSTMAERCRAELEERENTLIVVDEGALGRGYGNELRQRYSLPVVAAQKRDKLGFRKLLNGALVNDELVLVRGECDALVDELESLVWNPAGTDVAPSLADHVSDALLYVWRYSQAHRAEAPAQQPPVGSAEWYDAEAKRIEEAERERARLEREEGSWRSW